MKNKRKTPYEAQLKKALRKFHTTFLKEAMRNYLTVFSTLESPDIDKLIPDMIKTLNSLLKKNGVWK
jgi:hypothetical protein